MNFILSNGLPRLHTVYAQAYGHLKPVTADKIRTTIPMGNDLHYTIIDLFHYNVFKSWILRENLRFANAIK